jgi:acylphosphatase
VAQLGSAVAWGAKGRRFKSCRPDHFFEIPLYRKSQFRSRFFGFPVTTFFQKVKKIPIIFKKLTFLAFALGMRWFRLFNAFMGTIHGRVQGVGFRYYAKARADDLKITGWVRNLPNGTVEILAHGTASSLEQFMQDLKRGAIGSWVESSDFQWFLDEKTSPRFEIRF